MSLIAARRVRIREPRWCVQCERTIHRNESAMRLYGAADAGDPPYVIYVHVVCLHPEHVALEPKLAAALQPAAPRARG